MAEQSRITIVTGPPTSGKSTLATELLRSPSSYVVLDMDLLLPAASELAEKDVVVDQTTWRAYRRIWLAFASALVRNGKHPILLGNWSPRDLAEADHEEQFDVNWILLDCSDQVRGQRIRARDWGDEAVLEAAADANQLREVISTVVDTSTMSPAETAVEVLRLIACERPSG